jgi:hypothetical protein
LQIATREESTFHDEIVKENERMLSYKLIIYCNLAKQTAIILCFNLAKKTNKFDLLIFYIIHILLLFCLMRAERGHPILEIPAEQVLSFVQASGIAFDSSPRPFLPSCSFSEVYIFMVRWSAAHLFLFIKNATIF